jgi:glycosidase
MSGGQDPDNRRAFPWNNLNSWDTDTHDLIRNLIALRKEYPALRFGDWEAVWIDEEAIAYRRFDDQQQVLVVISRQKAIEDAVIPIKINNLEIIFGDTNFEKHKNGIKIKKQAPWSGSIFSI